MTEEVFERAECVFNVNVYQAKMWLAENTHPDWDGEDESLNALFENKTDKEIVEEYVNTVVMSNSQWDNVDVK